MASKYPIEEVTDPLAAAKDAREYVVSFIFPPASLPQTGQPGQVVPPTAPVQPNIQETLAAFCPKSRGDATSQDAGFKTEHGEVPAQTVQNTQEASTCTNTEPEEDIGFKTIKHVAQLPIVQETLTSAGNVYNKAKVS